MFRNRTIHRLLLLATVAFATAVSFSQGRTVTVTMDQNQSQVNLSIGDQLVLDLPANPSTGYSWQVVSNNPALLQPMPGTTRPAQERRDNLVGQVVGAILGSENPGAVGEGTIQSVRFRAVGSGGEALTLKYQRPWEGMASNAASFTILVVIRPSNGANAINVYPANNGGSVLLPANDTLRVHLPYNPSTGYVWSPVIVPDGIIEMAGSPQVRMPQGGMMGQTGEVIYTFKAMAPGRQWLRFISHRPFDSNFTDN
ncbi:MAG: protease inhibitor I42 family protein, partial [Fimbriimonadaceae bacterium]